MTPKQEALKLALEALEFIPESGSMLGSQAETKRLQAITAIREALAEPPCKTGSQCTNKCQQCEQPAQKQEPKRWAVFCSECRKEWSVSYPHPGKSICAECDAKAGAQQQEPNKDGSPCPEFWDWLPKAYNFEGAGNFTKYNMEVAFLAGKQSVSTHD